VLRPRRERWCAWQWVCWADPAWVAPKEGLN
jgi:hypothetical protein